MKYIEESLSTDEAIIELFDLHWINWIPMWIWIILAPVTLGLTLLIALGYFLTLRSVEQGLTNKRIIYKGGFISRSTQEMKISSVETVDVDQSVLGRILGYGKIRVTGRGISDVEFRAVKDPLHVKRTIADGGA